MWLVAGLLGLAALAAYWNTFSAPFVFDDAHAITENATIRRLWPLWTVLSPPGAGADASGRPVVNLSFAINHAISGDAPWSYHVLNLLIHIAAGCTLFGIARRTLAGRRLQDRFGRNALPLAAAIAALWLLHPLQTAAVTYVSERTESLAGLLALATLYGFIRSRAAATPRRALAWFGSSWVACLLAMATKETAVVVPLLVLIYDFIFIAEGCLAELRRRWRYHAALAATWLLLAALMAGTHGRGGTAGFATGLSPLVYFQTQCRTVVHYLGLCFWPRPLVFDYGMPVVRNFSAAWPEALLLLVLATATVIALRRRAAAGFLGAWFFLTLAPSSSILPIASQTVADHRMYLASAAVVTAVVIGLHRLAGHRSLWLWPAAAVLLGGATFARNETFRTELALWQDTVAKAPHNGRAHYNLGIVYSRQGLYARAVAEDEAALASDDGWAAASQLPAIHNKLGYDLEKLGRLPEAVTHYETALRAKPDYALAHLNLARALTRLDRRPEAITHYQAAIRLGAGGVDAETELAEALMHDGRFAEAVEHSRAVARRTPASAPAFNNLGYALISAGRADAAVAAYREAVRLDPRYAAAWVGLGYALISAGHPVDAIDPCRRAVALQPNLADAHNTLGIALAQSGRLPEAVASLQQALRLNPDAADVHNNLGNALADAGRTADAVAEYREAVRLRPDYADAHRNLGHELQRLGHTSEGAEHLATADRLEAQGSSLPPKSGD